MALITKVLESKVESSGDRWVVARISTSAVDRDGDVLVPSGVNVEDFEKNPVVLESHDVGGRPVGRASELRIGRKFITAKVTFAKRPESLPDSVEWPPDTLHDLFKQSVLSAFSVGFSIPPGGARPAEAKDVSRFGPGVKQVIERWDLHEFSVVTVPSNPDALAASVSKVAPWTSRPMGRINLAQYLRRGGRLLLGKGTTHGLVTPSHGNPPTGLRRLR